MAISPTVVADIKIKEGGQTLRYSKEGWKARRVFLVQNAEQLPGSGKGYGTAYNAYLNADIPGRGDNHPYLDGTDDTPQIMADEFEINAKDPANIEITVDYAHLNGLTQEVTADDPGTSNVALLTIASSLQSYQRATDVAGNPLNVPYCIAGPAAGQVTINPDGATPMPTSSPFPSINSKAQAQIPTMILRFQRRELNQRDPTGLVGYYNTSDWTISQLGGAVAEKNSALCTRVENVTQDGGVTWIVTYEFQIAMHTALAACLFQSPAASVTGSSTVSGWDVGLYYVLPSGTGTLASAGSGVYSGSAAGATVLQAGGVPKDAIPTIFAVYGGDGGAFAALGIT